MHTPTVWDRSPTDAELNSYYGKPRSTRCHEEIVEILTQTVRIAAVKNMALQYVKNESNGSAHIDLYPLTEVITDYGTDKGPLDALIAVIEKSDCPLVAAYRMALAERYSDANADELEEFTQ